MLEAAQFPRRLTVLWVEMNDPPLALLLEVISRRIMTSRGYDNLMRNVFHRP